MLKTQTPRRIAVVAGVFLCLAGLMSAPSSAATAPTTRVYKTCSWPKGPKVKHYRHARGWSEKGLTSPATFARGVDVSMWNHVNGKDINFAYMKAAYNVSFVIMKAGDPSKVGVNGGRKWYARDRAIAKRAGLIVGAYYYGKPGYLYYSNVRKDAIVQARQALWFASGEKSVTGAPAGDLPLTLDFEEKPCGWTEAQLATWAVTFMNEAERLSGRKTMVYASGVYINRLTNATPAQQTQLATNTLWAASWTVPKGVTVPEYPIWGTNWTFWQFSSDGSLKKSQVSARLDLDVFNGSPAQLAQFAAK